MALISAWDRQGSRSLPLFYALKRIFSQVLSSNVFISLHFIPSLYNPADFLSHPTWMPSFRRRFGPKFDACLGEKLGTQSTWWPFLQMFIVTFLASPFYSFRLILLLAAHVLVFLLISIQHPIPPFFYVTLTPSLLLPLSPSLFFSSDPDTSLHFHYSWCLSKEVVVALASGCGNPKVDF